MTRFLHASVALMTITGVVFAVMKYWMKSGDPFAVVNHPWQPHMLSAHVVLAPLAVFAFGWIFAVHTLPKLANGAPNRISGIANIVLIALMVASGYLLQISTGDATRRAFAVEHWVFSGLFVGSYVAHLFGSAARKRRFESGADAPHS
jgi:hypothetical protein